MEPPSPSGDPKLDLLRSVAADKAVVGAQLPFSSAGERVERFSPMVLRLAPTFETRSSILPG